MRAEGSAVGRRDPSRSRVVSWLLGVMLGVAGLAAAADGPSAFNLDWQAPNFELNTVTGDAFRYPEDLDKPTIVLFWATWCPFCKALMPHLQSILDEYGGSVRVVSLNFREDGDPAAYLADNGFQFELLPNAEDVAEAWNVKGTPYLFLARPDGHVVFSIREIPREDMPDVEVKDEKRARTQIAARMGPYLAARLRQALDQLEQEQS